MNLADLSTAKVSDVTFDVELKHPVTGAPLGLVAQIVGFHSDKVRPVVERQSNAALKTAFEIKRKAGDAITVDKTRRENAEKLAAATVDWFEREMDAPLGQKPKVTKGWQFGDDRLQFSESAAIQLYSDPAFAWLYAQIAEAADDIANFMKS
jgi:hypothetical protein